jgi:hypothetical protein
MGSKMRVAVCRQLACVVGVSHSKLAGFCVGLCRRGAGVWFPLSGLSEAPWQDIVPDCCGLCAFGCGAGQTATGSPLAGLSCVFGQDVPATRLRHFPRESLMARLSSGEASFVKVELAGGRASLTLTTRSEPHNRRAIHAKPE